MKIIGSAALVVAALFFAQSLIAGSLAQVYATDLSAFYGLDETAFERLVLILPAIFVVMQLVTGLVLDRFGARHTMMVAAALAALGLALSAAVPFQALGAAGRALHGIGAAFAFTGALVIASRCFGSGKFGFLAGLVHAFGFGALAAWLLVGQAWFEGLGLSWRYYGSAIAALVLALLFVMLTPTRDFVDNNRTKGFFGHILSELGSVLVRPRLWFIMAAAALAGVPLGLYGRVWDHMPPPIPHSPEGAGFFDVSVLFIAGFALGGFLSGLASDAIGRRRGALVLSLVSAALVFTLFGYAETVSALQLGAMMAVGGFFCGAAVLFYALVNDRSPPGRAGFHIGLVNGAFAAGAFGAVFGAELVRPLAEIVDLTRAFAPLCLAGAAFLALVMPDRGPMVQQEAAPSPAEKTVEDAAGTVAAEPDDTPPAEHTTDEKAEEPVETVSTDTPDDQPVTDTVKSTAPVEKQALPEEASGVKEAVSAQASVVIEPEAETPQPSPTAAVDRDWSFRSVDKPLKRKRAKATYRKKYRPRSS